MKAKSIFVLILVLVCLALGFAVKPETVAATTEVQSRQLPVIMYHNIHPSKRSRYSVTPAQLESDLRALQQNGFTTVSAAEVIAFVNAKASLPEKPVMITFDDGLYNNLHYALPLFEKYDCKGIINVIGAFTEFSTKSGDHSNVSYSHLTWEQITKLATSGRFEIGNHSYNMHNFKPRYGIAQCAGETDEDYRKVLTDDIMQFQAALMEKSRLHTQLYAYPFGKYNSISDKVLNELGYKMVFTCNEKVNTIRVGDTNALRLTRRFNRESSYTTAALLKKISK